MLDSNLKHDSTQGFRFVPQSTDENHRACGAASLAMAYQRCGISIEQNEIWNAIRHEHEGNFRAHTYHLAQDAIRRGLSACIIQSHQPLDILSACWQSNATAIVNHRLSEDSDEGHYSVLAGFNRDEIIFHDPLLGPSSAYTHDSFLSLWLPRQADFGEISGNVLLVITPSPTQKMLWCHCEKIIDSETLCESCATKISLQPASVLGCWNPRCSERRWLRIFCPNCDHPISELYKI